MNAGVKIGNRRREKQKGNTLVEGALTLLTLLLMITAVMDLGQILMFMQFFTERARSGARYAAVQNYDATTIKNYVVYNSATAPQGGGSGLFGLQTSHVSVNRYDTGAAFDRIEVSVQNFPLTFYTPLLPGSYTARSFKTVIPVESLGATN